MSQSLLFVIIILEKVVEWIFVDENIPIEEIYERGLSQRTMYKLMKYALKLDFSPIKDNYTLLKQKRRQKIRVNN
jgi:hypothetical protein